jgi:F-type H+-transporting ATPase subunit alpha
MHVADQVLIIYAGTRGHLDRIPISEVRKWEREFLTFIHHQKPEIWDELNGKKDLTDDITKSIESAIKEFQAQYAHGATVESEEREPVAV